MDTKKIVKEAKEIIVVTFVVGITLLLVGIVLTLLDIKLLANNKALVGLSFLPLSVAAIYYFKLRKINKTPQKMRNIIINENDERLLALRNEADAKAFKILQGALFLTYMGYTLMVPADIFESVGWWIIFVLFFIAFVSPGILQSIVLREEETKIKEE
ncbi:MAG: hypothetical protein WCI30_07845 [Clostridia bacterium]